MDYILQKATEDRLLTEDRENYKNKEQQIIQIQSESMTINENQVRKVIAYFKNRKSPGPGGINAELLKYGTEKLFKSLAFVLNAKDLNN